MPNVTWQSSSNVVGLIRTVLGSTRLADGDGIPGFFGMDPSSMAPSENYTYSENYRNVVVTHIGSKGMLSQQPTLVGGLWDGKEYNHL
jgi:hypothetical protein